jgi:endonuclease YncB( thermonuclease family)
MLYLELVPTRSHAGELLAYVYTAGDLLLNARLIEEGLAFADRRWDYSFARQFFHLEEQAQSRRRGIWGGVTEGQMPEWRQRWLAEMRKQPWERGQWVRDDEP